MAALTGGDMRNLGPHYIQPALEHLRKTDPAWVSEWVATQVAEGGLYEHEYWLTFATAIPGSLIEKYLERIETDALKNGHFGGMNSVIAACADADLAARVFEHLRELQRGVDAEPDVRHEREWQILRQLKATFRELPDDIAAAGILSSVSSGDPLDIKVAAGLLSNVARSDAEPLRVDDGHLRARIRAYLKSSVDVVLCQDDLNGEEKANLASSIAQVGQPEDMADLVKLISADIERVRRGRAASAAGDHGPLGNGGAMSYAPWHIAAVMQLDAAGAAQVLIDLLPEPEYRSEAAAAMARDFIPKSERSFGRVFRYDLMWAAREGRAPQLGAEQRRIRFADTINSEIVRVREQNQNERSASGLTVLAHSLATIDGHRSASVVLDVISKPGQWDQYTCVDTAEVLLMKGVVLPATTAFALVGSFLERTENWMQDSDRYLLRRILALCALVDDSAAGVAQMRYVIQQRQLWAGDLREIITALGESRSEEAVDLLYELASDASTFQQCGDNIINGLAASNTQFACELLQGFVDPDVRSIALTHRLNDADLLVARLAELAQRCPEVAARLKELCERDLPDLNRHVLSKVMGWLGTPETLAANLQLIDDAKKAPVPQGVWDQLESAFVERQSYGETSNIYKIQARAANELRARLFRMALDDTKRRKSAFLLLGRIERWRLEHGRPTDEMRHPDLTSGTNWPPVELWVTS